MWRYARLHRDEVHFMDESCVIVAGMNVYTNMYPCPLRSEIAVDTFYNNDSKSMNHEK